MNCFVPATAARAPGLHGIHENSKAFLRIFVAFAIRTNVRLVDGMMIAFPLRFVLYCSHSIKMLIFIQKLEGCTSGSDCLPSSDFGPRDRSKFSPRI
jgi:hypothetical protein